MEMRLGKELREIEELYAALPSRACGICDLVVLLFKTPPRVQRVLKKTLRPQRRTADANFTTPGELNAPTISSKAPKPVLSVRGKRIVGWPSRVSRTETETNPN